MPDTNNTNENGILQEDIKPNRDLTRFKFESFDVNKDSWKYYYQRFEVEINVNGLQGNSDAQRILLLKWIGAEHYKIIVDNFDPTPILTVNFQDIITFLDNFYKSKTSYLAERLKFGRIIKPQVESVSVYINKLRSAATECRFKDTLEERLRDQFLLGLNNSSMQEELIRLHPEDNAKLPDILKDADLLEMAHLQREQICSDTNEQVNKVKYSYFNKPKFELKSKKPTFYLDSATHCIRCGLLKHKQNQRCKALQSTCRGCGQIGHFETVCLKSGNVTLHQGKWDRSSTSTVSKVKLYNSNDSFVDISGNSIINCAESKTWENDSDFAASNLQPINNVTSQNHMEQFSYVVNVSIQNVPITMEYDTAAARTIISKSTWENIGMPDLSPTTDLGAYPSFRIKMLGQATVNVKLGSTYLDLNVAVTDSYIGTPLFGKDWINAFKLDPSCKHVIKSNSVIHQVTLEKHFDKNSMKKQLYCEYKDILTNNLGTIKNFKAKVRVLVDVKLPIHKPRIVPFALKEATSKELDRLVSAGVLEPVDPCNTQIICASPIVVVPKSNGEVRVCGDFKVSINPYLIDDDYSIPTFEETTDKLNNSRIFSVIDLKDAYLQLPVDDESKKYLVITTEKGYFTFNRLPFGIKTAPKIFQKFMDQLLVGLDKVAWYFDDICVGGESETDHINKLQMVLNVLRNAGLCTREDKLQLFKDSVVYLGHKISAEGIHPIDERVEAIHNQPSPRNVTELRSFLGAINYYSRFIPHLQSLCYPLHKLLHKHSTWNWNENCEKVFTTIKNSISSTMTLVHYDPKCPLVLATDACNYGLGAVLLQQGKDGTQKPIAAASRTLLKAEENYSSIDKEGLAIIFGINKFYKYIYGRHFTLLCDHKPLERIFGEKQPIPKHAASRLARWAIILSGYDYDIKYTAGKDNVLADCLSRMPLKNNGFLENSTIEINQVRLMKLEDLPLTKNKLQSQTHKDEMLKHVITYCLRGWPEKKSIPNDFHIYYDKRFELSYEDGLLLWQERIVIPESLRKNVLEYLHEAHPGIVAMRSLAKMYVYWPKIDEDVEHLVKCCNQCQKFRKADVDTPLNSWNIPNKPWSRIHIDFKGPFEGYMWLVVVDAYSRWLEIFPMKQATSQSVIKCLRELFCRYGLEKLVTELETSSHQKNSLNFVRRIMSFM